MLVLGCSSKDPSYILYQLLGYIQMTHITIESVRPRLVAMDLSALDEVSADRLPPNPMAFHTTTPCCHIAIFRGIPNFWINHAQPVSKIWGLPTYTTSLGSSTITRPWSTNCTDSECEDHPRTQNGGFRSHGGTPNSSSCHGWSWLSIETMVTTGDPPMPFGTPRLSSVKCLKLHVSPKLRHKKRCYQAVVSDVPWLPRSTQIFLWSSHHQDSIYYNMIWWVIDPCYEHGLMTILSIWVYNPSLNCGTNDDGYLLGA